MAEIARHVRVTGQVQGVFFRAWTAEQASGLGVTGWVRNCSDGSVEAHVEGDSEKVAQMIDRIGSGPRSAQVEDVRVEQVQVEGHQRFEVRH